MRRKPSKAGLFAKIWEEDVNQSELIARIADQTGMAKAQVSRVVEAMFDGISDALKKGEEARFPGFGSFKVAERAARQGKNPRTGETIQIAASKQPKFTAGKGLKDAVNG